MLYDVNPLPVLQVVQVLIIAMYSVLLNLHITTLEFSLTFTCYIILFLSGILYNRGSCVGSIAVVGESSVQNSATFPMLLLKSS